MTTPLLTSQMRALETDLRALRDCILELDGRLSRLGERLEALEAQARAPAEGNM